VAGVREKEVPMLLLHDLLRQYDPRLSLSSIPNVELSAVQEDSRLVKPGSLFIARSGSKTDGARFLADAKARGAVAAVVEANVPGAPLPQVVVTDSAAASSVLANVFLDRPSDTVKVLGVTG